MATSFLDEPTPIRVVFREDDNFRVTVKLPPSMTLVEAREAILESIGLIVEQLDAAQLEFLYQSVLGYGYEVIDETKTLASYFSDKAWRDNATPGDRIRLQAYSAKGGGQLYGVTPSVTLDMQLTSSEFATNVACTLHV